MDKFARFPNMKIKFVIRDKNGQVYHEGTFNYHDDKERRAVGERVRDVYIAGHSITTWRIK
jgi:hypothetical protein